MSKKAFTLIEVLVSVIILSTVAVMLFEISTNSKNSFSYLTKKGDFTTLHSLALMHSDQSLHNSEKNLYEFIRDDYNIKDDELRKYLKEKKVHYEHQEFTTFEPLGGSENEDEDSNQSVNFKIVFDKIFVGDKENSTFIYKMHLR